MQVEKLGRCVSLEVGILNSCPPGLHNAWCEISKALLLHVKTFTACHSEFLFLNDFFI